jgi:hypothetical protein|tara:strand:+ start:655 stop:891 length:237 start_codon:yes stop_codon:yes gene_type:complete
LYNFNNKEYGETIMKNILKYILSLIIFFGATPALPAMDYSDKAGMSEEIKKKKKSKKKKIKKGKKKKKGFFSKFKGSK